jgi:carbon-monoxide dehydrogenase large subunit
MAMQAHGAEASPVAATAVPRAVGARVLRREDARLVAGRGRYVSDVTLPRLLHAAFARSPHAHARLGAIDTSAAKALPGVVAVLTAADLDGVARPLRARNGTPNYQECNTPILATGKVRVVGEPVALVIAESRYVAEDAVERVSAAWKPLEPILTIDDALAPGAAAIHDDVAGNLFNHFETATGDVEGAFAAADEVVELEVDQQRYGAAAMEQRVVMASYDRSDEALTVWLSTQVPHIARTGLAQQLGLPENRVRVIAPDMGGGFGPKCVLYPEDVAVAAASKLVGRPVKWVSDRVEDLLATVHGREHVCRIRAAATRDGRVEAVTAELYASNGAYAPWPYTAALESGQASENVTGPYDIPAYRRRVHAVVTNKAPVGPYRGVGRVIACLSMERVMDELARRLGLDPVEVRRLNLIRAFPHTTAVGLTIESGDYLRMLDTLEEAMDWAAVRERDAALRAEGRWRGTGVALAVEQSAYGPQALGSRRLEMTLGYDSASVRMEPDGLVRVAVGLHNHGQGHETTIAQIAADELGLEPDNVQVVYGDTAVVPYGMGTWASRSTVTSGGATILASRDLRDQILELAADMLEANPADLVLAGGRVGLQGSPSRGLEIRDIARRANFEPHLLPPGVEPGLEVTRRYVPPDPGSFSSSAHGAHVEVDLETGDVEVLRYGGQPDDRRRAGPRRRGAGHRRRAVRAPGLRRRRQPARRELRRLPAARRAGGAADRGAPPGVAVAARPGRLQGHGRGGRGQLPGGHRQRRQRRTGTAGRGRQPHTAESRLGAGRRHGRARDRRAQRRSPKEPPVKPPPFEYHDPRDLDEALALLAEHGEEGKVLAGGQSLVPLLNFRLAHPEHVIDVNRVGGLDYVRRSDGALRIGAMTRQSTLEAAPLVAQRWPMITEALEFVAHPQIRNRGTVGGSVAHADPAAELPVTCAALDARMHVRSSRGTRTIEWRDFFVTHLTTAMEPDELLCEVEFPALPDGAGTAITEYARRHGDFALGGAAVLLDMDGETCRSASIALLGATDKPVRAEAAERSLAGARVDEDAAAEAGRLASADIEPTGDIHGSSDYRRRLIGAMVRRAVLTAAHRAGR